MMMDKRAPDGALRTLRERWRTARAAKISRRDELIAAGMDRAAVRRDRAYRAGRTMQRRYARMILHIEKKMNRKRAREKDKK